MTSAGVTNPAAGTPVRRSREEGGTRVGGGRREGKGEGGGKGRGRGEREGK